MPLTQVQPGPPGGAPVDEAMGGQLSAALRGRSRRLLRLLLRPHKRALWWAIALLLVQNAAAMAGPFLVMELVRGKDLREILTETPRLAPGRAVRIVLEHTFRIAWRQVASSACAKRVSQSRLSTSTACYRTFTCSSFAADMSN